MIRQLLGIVLFYGRFSFSFSRIGWLRRRRGFEAIGKQLEGKHVVITGASGGIGAAAVAGCIDAGATVTAVARSPEKLARLKQRHGDQVTLLTCDLAESSQVALMAEDLADMQPVDVLINNVGVMLHEFQQNSDGTDLQFATNLLNHYLLTESLITNGALHATSQVINVASGGMYMAPMVIGKLFAGDAADHDGTTAYAIQKRAQVMLTHYWQQRETEARRFNVMHPGWVDTAGVQQSLPTFRKLMRPILRSAVEGADTIVWLAACAPNGDTSDQIWLDRELCKVHAYSFTRSASADIDALLEALNEALPADLAESLQAPAEPD
ncbi:MAG: SDR family NAD(P)-dependent oxidoreductase [Pseudomonadota bacterium]